MYAPHFAAALAINARSPGAPLWALLIGAFIPDLAWIAFARIGIEPAQASNFFDRLVSFAGFRRDLGDAVCVGFSPQGQTSFCHDFAGRVLTFPARFSGSPEAACPRAFERSLSGMGPVGVGFTSRMAWCNQRLVVAISGSVGVASGLCDRVAQNRSSADSRCWVLCAAHRDSVANTVSMHRLLNQRFASASYR